MNGFRTTKLISALLVGCLSVACSNGERQAKPSATQVKEPTPVAEMAQPISITGNVVKGLVRNAQVSIYAVEAGQRFDSALASTITDEQGQFELQLTEIPPGDLLYLEVVGAADGTSQMNCDASVCGILPTLQGIDADGDGAIGLGETIQLSPDFRLSSVLTNFKSSEHLSVSITPFSHFAVERAIAEGDLSRDNVQHYMQQIATLLNMPTTLSQMHAIDPTAAEASASGAPGQVKASQEAVQYGLVNAAVASMAAQRDQNIEQTIQEVSESLYNGDDTVNRELVVELLQHALIEARRLAKNDRSLQALITDIQLLIGRYRCDVGLDGEDQCGPVIPPVPPVEPEDELQTVKAFVADFRGWARDIALQSDPALSNFNNRTQLVSSLWEDDLKELTSVLNDLLPGVAQTVSPSYSFCYYCANNGRPTINGSGDRVLDMHGLRYLLVGDGTMHISGTLRGVTVDVDLSLPALHSWNSTHAIEITAGRLSKDGVDLVLTSGSQIAATYDYQWSFSQVANDIANPYLRPPEAVSLRVDANFFVQAEYSVSPGAQISFEEGSQEYAHVLNPQRWAVSSNRSAAGSRALQSNRIGHFQKTQAVAEFTTTGGEFTFDYALESERGFDFFNVYVDGNRILRQSGHYPQFRSARAFLAPGQHRVVFEYAKDGSVNAGSDAAWIDNIAIPGLVGALGFEELATRNVMSGNLSVTAHKLRGPWYASHQGFLPSDVTISAHMSNDFSLDDSESGTDEISFNFAANFANVADFVAPQTLDEQTLTKLGHYTVSEGQFTLFMPSWRAEITRVNAFEVRFESFRSGSDEPWEAYTSFVGTDPVHEVAGQLLSNSAIGWHVIEPEQGLYVTTLLNASPWSQYEQSQFSANGGDVYGYLVEPFSPTETQEQFIAFAASLETTLDIEGFPPTTLGTSLSRDSFEEGIFDLYIELAGNRFNVRSQYWLTPEIYGAEASVDLQDRLLSIQNQHGVELHLRMAENTDADPTKDSYSVKGELIYNNKAYGEIERVKGLTIIRYIDGSGESLE